MDVSGEGLLQQMETQIGMLRFERGRVWLHRAAGKNEGTTRNNFFLKRQVAGVATCQGRRVGCHSVVAKEALWSSVGTIHLGE